MQAVVVREYGEPSVLKVETVPRPAPAAGQVLIKVHAIGVNPYEVGAASTHCVKLTPPGLHPLRHQ